MKIAALAGGVGGAKLADGLYRTLPAGDLTVIVNTGDDFTHLGLKICPDLDTVCYTLAGKANPSTGWGRSGETYTALSEISSLEGPDWFRLGDRDLGTHLVRTQRMREGSSLSQITRAFCASWGIHATILPMSDDIIATIVHTRNHGSLNFQEYFVKLHCQPEVVGFQFDGIGMAKPAPGVIEAIESADAIVLCPSNPWVSIAPILTVKGVREAIRPKFVLSVSPLIGGQALKGPAAKMFSELGWQPSAQAVAEQYRDFLNVFLLDPADRADCDAIRQWGIISYVTDVIMKDIPDRIRLANEILDLINQRLGGM
ncbi:LPPG:FO 2-phospho-L-lactate transferase [Longilinea arvoryzae]|uniref:LPPG:FO 2-phospho-L-lactate transferase n=1 Tax=Longilinea arvoryzae TaxID=360412 RepID=A0A0S7BJE3_9CHLR|nr:2-phospho-L-lactate transferase [Longilinea arvoryzae]GAP14707.1 LPPG:FO 2-phospho-L-lactate transferase [Longilinea arvoryzae]